jgi:hypothetical protein
MPRTPRTPSDAAANSQSRERVNSAHARTTRGHEDDEPGVEEPRGPFGTPREREDEARGQQDGADRDAQSQQAAHQAFEGRDHARTSMRMATTSRIMASSSFSHRARTRSPTKKPTREPIITPITVAAAKCGMTSPAA